MYASAPLLDERFQQSDLVQFDYAHRGLHNNSTGIPENSLRSFELAVEYGYGVELDLQLTSDGQVVVFHDRDLTRLCGNDSEVSQLTLDELRSYTLLETDQTVPTFAEALRTVGERVPIIVELKNFNSPQELCPLVWQVLKDYQGLYCIESFNPKVVQWFKENQPQVMRGQLMDGDPGSFTADFDIFVHKLLCSNFLTRPDFTAYDCSSRDTPAMQAAKHLFVMPEISWTVRDADTYQKLKDENCIIIFEGFLPDGASEEKQQIIAASGDIFP